MRAFKVLCCLGVVAMLCASVQALDPASNSSRIKDVPDLAESVVHVHTQGGAALATEPALVYSNVNAIASGLDLGYGYEADDVSLVVDSANLKGYDILFYSFVPSATLDVEIYKMEDCSDANALTDTFGACCPGATPLHTETLLITAAGYNLFQVTIDPAIVVPQDLWVGVNASVALDEVLWIISNLAEVGYTGDVWLEDPFGACALWYFGPPPAPKAGFYLEMFAESAAAYECVPVAISGAGSIDGNTATLECGDQNVEVEWFARDWDPGGASGEGVIGYQTRLLCEDFVFDAEGTLVPSDNDDSPLMDDPFPMGIDKFHAAYFFPFPPYEASGGCNSVDCCDKTNPPCLACVTSGDPCAVDADCVPPDAGECSVAVPAGYYSCLQGITAEGQSVPDTGEMKYMNTYSFYVPVGANDSAVISLDRDPNQLILTGVSGNLAPIAIVPCVIEVTTGMCCRVVTEPLQCIDGIDACECADLGGDFMPGMACSGLDDVAPFGLDDACGCEDSTQCADGDACTENVCVDNACVNTVLTVPAGSCCDPTVGTILDDIDGLGEIVSNFDDDQCTLDLCSAPGTCAVGDQCGVPSNPIDDGADCDDGNACTIDDVCDAGGACAGDDYNSLGYTCPGGLLSECPAGATSCDEGICKCSLSTPLMVVVNDEDCCFAEGEAFTADVYMGPGSEWIVGAQFMVTWDPTCIEFTGYTAGTVFPLSLYEELGDDYLFLAMGIDPFDGTGTQGDVDLATLGFVKLGDCTECEICFASVNPMNTLLTSREGKNVEADLSCSCWIVQEGESTMDLPGSVLVNSDCMHNTAVVTWDDAPAASQECFGVIDLTCTAAHEPLPGEDPMDQNDLDALIMGGGEFAQGTTTFCCGGDGACDIEVYDCWTVEVTNQNSMDVVVQLSPFMTTGAITRCIEFAFYWSCQPLQVVEWSQDLVFGPPYDFPGKSTPVLKVPKGEYGCITAKDPLHTLRSSDYEVTCDPDTGMMVAAFHGDPLYHGGNWLVGGNLDGNDTIDIMDFGTFVSQFLTAPGADTPCGYVGPHADINGDGLVDAADFAFISMNFLMASKTACCDPVASTPVPVTEISVKELKAMGMGHLAVADLNHDGVLNADDMTEFMQGNVPAASERDTKRTGVRSTLSD